MTLDFGQALAAILADTSEVGALRMVEIDLPEGPWEWVLGAGGFLAALVIIIVLYGRDTAEVSGFWRAWLTMLRVSVLAALVVIAINPQERTQRMSYRPSRVAVLIDRSLSMRYPAGKSGESSSAVAAISRADAVERLLARSSLISTLKENHEVSIYSFDSTLNGPHQVFRSTDSRIPGPPPLSPSDHTTSVDPSSDAAGGTGQGSLDWLKIVQPQGLETRLGESLLDLIRQIGGKTLSGIVVLTDGGANAGVEPSAAQAAAKAAKVRLITVGVGTTEQPINLQVATVQAPTDVHLGDSFEISAFVQGQGLDRQTVQVELLRRPEAEEGEPVVIETRQVQLFEDGVPVEVKFDRNPSEAGSVEYFVRARATSKLSELSEDDNERRKTINVLDRKTRVLLIAGGPMRDYRFVRNMLFRHVAIQLDVWLQSAEPGAAVSQDSDSLVFQFPEERAELFDYDVIIAFDPNWTLISPESLNNLAEWVYAQAGGMILVAGSVHTEQLASASDEYKSVLELYPVILNSYLLDFQSGRKSEQAWPIQFTRDGQDAGFLQLTDDTVSSSQTWEEFGGVYRCYPTGGPKAGAVVFAHFSDPRAATEHGSPILLAAHFYGSGRILYFGTSEMWRLRALDEEFHDRLWTKAVREIAQSRMRRGTNRGMLLSERNQYAVGQTVRIRAHLLDPQFKPLTADTVVAEVFRRDGTPADQRLVRDKNRPGQFVGDFRASLPGTYRIELEIPESNDRLIRKIDVVLPNLETDNSRLNTQLLRNLVQETGGVYLPLDEAASAIPKWLPNQGEEFLVDERLRTLWDRSWVLYLLVAVLSVEWLTRKLLKLA